MSDYSFKSFFSFLFFCCFTFLRAMLFYARLGTLLENYEAIKVSITIKKIVTILFREIQILQTQNY